MLEESNGLSPGIFYAVAGVTGAAAIAWGVCGALALSANSSYGDSSNAVRSSAAGDSQLPTRVAQAQSDADSARQFALWSDIALGVTLAGAIGGTILYFKTDFGGHRVNVTGAPTAQGGSLLLTASF